MAIKTTNKSHALPPKESLSQGDSFGAGWKRDRCVLLLKLVKNFFHLLETSKQFHIFVAYYIKI